jgi:hypothetical protein
MQVGTVKEDICLVIIFLNGRSLTSEIHASCYMQILSYMCLYMLYILHIICVLQCDPMVIGHLCRPLRSFLAMILWFWMLFAFFFTEVLKTVFFLFRSIELCKNIFMFEYFL